MVKNLQRESGDTSLIPGSGNPLEKKMATHSSILGKLHGQTSWRLQSEGSQRVGHERETEQASKH